MHTVTRRYEVITHTSQPTARVATNETIITELVCQDCPDRLISRVMVGEKGMLRTRSSSKGFEEAPSLRIVVGPLPEDSSVPILSNCSATAFSLQDGFKT